MRGGRSMRKQNGKEAGFSLIEVLITIFILGVVCITLVSVFIYGFNLLQKTKKVALATQIAQEEIEIYRNMNYDDVKIKCPSEGVVTFASLSDENTAKAYLSNTTYFTGGLGSVSIEREAVPGDDIRKLTVRITWLFHGRSQEKNVVTYISRYGINGVKDFNKVF